MKRLLQIAGQRKTLLLASFLTSSSSSVIEVELLFGGVTSVELFPFSLVSFNNSKALSSFPICSSNEVLVASDD